MNSGHTTCKWSAMVLTSYVILANRNQRIVYYGGIKRQTSDLPFANLFLE